MFIFQRLSIREPIEINNLESLLKEARITIANELKIYMNVYVKLTISTKSTGSSTTLRHELVILIIFLAETFPFINSATNTIRVPINTCYK